MVSLGKDGTGVAGMESRDCSTDDGSLPEHRELRVSYSSGALKPPMDDSKGVRICLFLHLHTASLLVNIHLLIMGGASLNPVLAYCLY